MNNKNQQESDEKRENLFEKNLLDEKIDKFFDGNPSDEEIDKFFEENPKEKERFLEELDEAPEYIVSEEFKDIFFHFNVSDQREKMKQLEAKELYLLLICCIDLHDEEQEQVILNLSDFENEIDQISEFSEKEKTENEVILLLTNEIDPFITTSNIDLPNVLSKTEAFSLMRENKLNQILDK